ncbi:outer membrane lipoprotein Blc-like [Amphiura filiformis]|uniref:outer membrane lipoprotein Blc-like n=1 Tax=Amphiura filiformis TaxID=82378 RepID=UPI003B21554E
MYRVVLLVAVCLLGLGEARQTVPQLSVERYIGRWYQTYANYWADLFANLPNPECATADYGVINATYISVRNSNFYTETKERREIEGYAWLFDANEPGQLKLQLAGVPVVGDYWVFKLGPVVDNMYQYSLITDADSLQLFVLARDPVEFMELYDAEVREYLELVGFTGQRKEPVLTPHTEACEYLPPIDQSA